MVGFHPGKVCRHRFYKSVGDFLLWANCSAIGPLFLFWIIEIIDEHNGFVTAIATFIMAAFTGTLWFVTNKAVNH